jgi:uncharacterized protein (DUF362 family)/Pyruvate/2-oxoacid:ferredoxin oxidoreductase delta subunit
MKVSVVKMQVHDEDAIRKNVKKAIDLIGGMQSVVKSGDSVIIKPNFGGPRSSSDGATTNLTVLQEIVEEVEDRQATPIIAEGPFRRYNTKVVFSKVGVDRLANTLGVELIDLNDCESAEVTVPRGKALKRIKLAKRVLDADALINVPKMKTHHITKVTLGMKNLKGILPGEEKQQSHIHGIHQAIVDINKSIAPDLTVVDGIIAMEGVGPAFGDPVDLGVIVAGKNVVDVDKVCCEIMGINPLHVEHVRIADEEGLGSAEVQVVGEPIDAVTRKFKFLQESTTYLIAHSVAQKADRVLYRLIGKSIFPLLSGKFGKRPIIDKTKCAKCHICEQVCILAPPPAIDCSSGKIDYQRCADCLLCMEQCPTNAISVRGMTSR